MESNTRLSWYERERQSIIDIVDREFEEKFGIPAMGLREMLPRLPAFEVWFVFHVYTGVLKVLARSVDAKDPDPDVKVLVVLEKILSTTMTEHDLLYMNMDKKGQEILKSVFLTATRGIVASRVAAPFGWYSYEQMICQKISSVNIQLAESPQGFRNMVTDWSPTLLDIPARGEKPYDERASMSIRERRYGRSPW